MSQILCFWKNLNQKSLSSLTNQHVTEPTRYDNILDLVFSSEADMIEDVDVREPAVNSDHCTIHFKLVVRRQAKNNPDRQTRDYNRGDWESIRRDLHAIAWKPLLEDKTCEEQLKIFTELIEQQVDRKIPWRRQRGKHTPRWMNKRMHQNQNQNVDLFDPHTIYIIAILT